MSRTRIRRRYMAGISLLVLATAVVVALLFMPFRSSGMTSPEQPSEGAVLAQAGYATGHSTAYVASRRSDIPSNWGDAKQWYRQAQAAGFVVGPLPQAGAVAWTSRGAYGNVAYVESVSADGARVTVSAMNFSGDWNVITNRELPAGYFDGYIYRR